MTLSQTPILIFFDHKWENSRIIAHSFPLASRVSPVYYTHLNYSMSVPGIVNSKHLWEPYHSWIKFTDHLACKD